MVKDAFDAMPNSFFSDLAKPRLCRLMGILTNSAVANHFSCHALVFMVFSTCSTASLGRFICWCRNG